MLGWFSGIRDVGDGCCSCGRRAGGCRRLRADRRHGGLCPTARASGCRGEGPRLRQANLLPRRPLRAIGRPQLPSAEATGRVLPGLHQARHPRPGRLQVQPAGPTGTFVSAYGQGHRSGRLELPKGARSRRLARVGGGDQPDGAAADNGAVWVLPGGVVLGEGLAWASRRWSRSPAAWFDRWPGRRTSPARRPAAGRRPAIGPMRRSFICA